MAFHSVLPELSAREVRFVRTGSGPEALAPGLPADEHAYIEFYCEDLDCDCRRVFLQVMAKNQPHQVFASINYGWEPEDFYRKKTPWEPDSASGIVRGELDPMNAQSPFSSVFLELFQRMVLDAEYRLRLARHSRLFREALAQRRPNR